MDTLTSAVFGTLPDGREITSWTLSVPDGIEVEILAYGARIHRLMVPDADGTRADVVLGRRDLEGYSGQDYHGACIGRFTNRLGDAQFALDGEVFELDCNDGKNNLHGGDEGLHQAVFELIEKKAGEKPSITLQYVSPDGESKFPGTMTVRVRYALIDPMTLEITYWAETDKPCPFNPTQHAFFDLGGRVGQGSILDTQMQIAASKVTDADDELIPTGTLLDVTDGTGACDFREPKPIGRDITADERLLKVCGGYDHNFCVDGEGFRFHAAATDPGSGRRMEVHSDLPGIQLYTFNFGDDARVGKLGEFYKPHSAFCLETQFWPDAPNHENFEQCTVKPDETFTTRTEYRFS